MPETGAQPAPGIGHRCPGTRLILASNRLRAMLLSLFCGAGGLDLGFEQTGFEVGLAFDIREDSVRSYLHNRPETTRAYARDVRTITLEALDALHGGQFAPQGVIGGPPCQSFTQAVHGVPDDDPRHTLPLVYADLLAALNRRQPVGFFVLENVPGLCDDRHAERFRGIHRALESAGFQVATAIMDAKDYRVPQSRERVFMVGINPDVYGTATWTAPAPAGGQPLSVRNAIGHLREPFHFSRRADPLTFPHHPNHWCMRPKSEKFTRPGALRPGDGRNRSFKTLSWDAPSFTVAYGHREVHVHPECRRRLSVYEAMLLQGFPEEYELLGTLSSQITQVSEAVPPPLARAVADSIAALGLPAVAQEPRVA